MPFNIEHLGLEQGISQSTVNDLAQDEQGFLWIATQEGLNRYDGNIFKHFKHDPNDSLGLSGNFITSLGTDSKGNIWIGTDRNGLNYYDQNSHAIKSVHIEEVNLKRSTVNGIIEAEDHKLWVALENEGLLRLNLEPSPAFDTLITFDGAKTMRLMRDHRGEIWVATTGEVKSLNSDKKVTVSIDEVVMSLYRTGHKLFVGTESSLIQYDLDSNEMDKIELDSTGAAETQYVASITAFNHEAVWVGTGNGVYLYDHDRKVVLNHFKMGDRQRNGLSNGTVQSLLQMDNNQLVVGTANGLNILSFSPSIFKNISKSIKGKHYSTLLNDNVVFSIFKDGKYFWIGTSDGGLNLIVEDKAYYFKEDKKVKNSIVGGTIRGIAKDEKSNRLWVASSRGLSLIDLHTFDPNNPEFLSFKHDPEDPNSIPTNFIRDIIVDPSGTLWAATGLEGIFSLRYDRHGALKVRKFTSDPTKSDGLPSNKTYCITLIDDNQIMVGTGNGLSSFVIGQEHDPLIFTNHKINSSTKNLPENVIYDILKDRDGNLWTASRRGLSKLGEDGNFQSWYRQKQFPNDVVYSLLEDEGGNIWMATNNGLVRFNPESNEFSHFNTKDGIQSREFNLHAKFKDASGNLYFGGLQGITHFSPNHLDQIDERHPIYLYEARVRDSITDTSSYGVLQMDPQNNTLEFKHNDFPFYMRFSWIDFRTYKNTSLAYKLLPIDQDWNPIRNEEIQFLDLSPGSYTLLVNGFSRGKQWETDPYRVHIKIFPPWWKTWWAYLLYFLVLLGTFFFIYWFLLTRKLAVNENSSLKEMSEFRTNLFANITHEFRTPLMIILGLSQNLRDQAQVKTGGKINDYLDVMDRNTSYMLDLVNDILDLNKLEIKEHKLHLKQADVIAFVNYLFDSFRTMAKEKDINFMINDEVQYLMMDFDSEKLTKVISNLISNALKFTQKNGKVAVQLKLKENKKTRFLKIDVIDNGIGMTNEDANKVFDRFYRSKNAQAVNAMGSGIGLALTRELVLLMEGSIKVKSTLNVGSRFSVSLPVTNDASIQDINYSKIKPNKIKYTLNRKMPTGLKEDIKSPIVLIVEDNPDVQFYLTSCLSEDFNLIYAEDGQMGLDLAVEHIPDMIISDVLMPKKTGFEMCRALKSDMRTDHIPVILLTAKTQDKWRLQGLSSGADAYMSKPFIKEELFIVIRQLILKKDKLIQRFNKNYTKLIDKNKKGKKKSSFIDKAIELVLKNLDDSSFGPTQLAEGLNLSESQVYRKLKATTDKSTALFIRSIRLEVARNMLETTNKTVSEICYDVGFNDPSWFSRAFKEAYGHSPSEHANSI